MAAPDDDRARRRRTSSVVPDDDRARPARPAASPSLFGGDGEGGGMDFNALLEQASQLQQQMADIQQRRPRPSSRAWPAAAW